jgi:hypothetical protein
VSVQCTACSTPSLPLSASQTIQKGGNAKAKGRYEANLPANFRRPQDDYSVEQFIRNKYERKLYISKDISMATESKSEPVKAKVKESKKQSSSHKKDQVSVPHVVRRTRLVSHMS